MKAAAFLLLAGFLAPIWSPLGDFSLGLSSAYADSNTDRLLELTRDNDPSVRQSALRSLRYYMGNYDVQERVQEILANEQEATEVRMEAVKDMASVGSNTQISGKLLELAKGEMQAE